MHHHNYTSTKTGQLVPIDHGQFAFVPDPLPPDLTSSWELMNCLSEADRALAELAGTARTLPNPELIARPFMSREAVLSSQIEGTQASLSDLAFFEASGHEVPRSDALEVFNYLKALQHGIDMLKDLPICLRLIREVHERLLRGVRGKERLPGKFRTIQNYIASPGSRIEEARFVPPPPREMERAMNDLEKYVNGKHEGRALPPLVRIAMVHHQFETIHPFEDGNGRIGRLLVTLMLCAEKLIHVPMLYLSAYFERSRKDYYDLLLAVSQEGNWEQWLRYFLRGVTLQSRDALHRAQQLTTLWKRYRDKLQSEPCSSALGLKLVDEIFLVPMVTARRAEQRLGVTFRSAIQTIERLVANGILEEMTGRARNRVFVAREIISLLEAEDDQPTRQESPPLRTEQ